MTRVLQVISALNYGGAEDVVVKLALGLDPKKFESHVCGTLGLGPLADRLTVEGVSVRRAGPAGRVHNYLRPWHLYRVIAEVEPDVVHSHGLPPMTELGQLALAGVVPTWIHTFHFGNYPHTEKRRHMRVERILSSAPDRLVAVSDKQRDDLIGYHRIAPARIVTIANGVNPNSRADDPGLRRQMRLALGVPPEAFVVGTVAVLSEQKGVTYLLQAARQLLRLHPAWRFVIVGGGPLEGALRAEAEQLGIAESVVFTSWRSDAKELLCAFDVYVMASLWEALPIALLEAMAAGRAIVVTDVGQNAQIVTDQESALVIPPAAAGAIADAIVRLSAEPGLAARLATRARDEVDRRFGTSRMVNAYEALYLETRVVPFRPARLLAEMSRW